MTDAEIASKFWKALKSDRTIMLGLDSAADSSSQPMTAVLGDTDTQGPIWIFTSKQTEFAQSMGDESGAHATFASKGHEVFATLNGRLRSDEDRAVIDRLWSPFIAAWYPGGKDDPDLLLLRLDLTHAHVWLNDASVFAGVKLLLGVDPKEDYKDKSADLSLN
jgi:general stress protein 26